MKINFTNFKWFFLFGFLCAIESSFAQSANFEWYRTIFNSDNPPEDQKINDIAVSKIDSSVYIVGSCEGTNTAGLGSAFSINLGVSGFLAKYNKNGVRQWSFKVGGLGAEEISSVALNSVGEVIIGGYFEQNIYFQKNDGTFVIGSSSINITGDKNAFIVKVNTLGTDLVAFTPDKQLFVCANDALSSGVSEIVVDSTDNVFVAINFEQFIQNNGAPIVQHTGTGEEAVIVKFAAQSGVFTLANEFRVIQGSGNESITGLATDNNKLYFVGNTTSATINTKQSSFATINSSFTALGGGKNIFMAKCNNLNLTGAAIQTSHNDKEQFVNDIQYQGGNLYITGSANIGGSLEVFLGPATGTTSLSINTPSSNEKVFLAKYNTSFEPVWVRVLQTGQSDDDKGNELDLDANGNIFITGHIKSDFVYKSSDTNYFFSNQLIASPSFETVDTITSSNKDAFVAKFNNNGQHQWIRLIGFASGNEGIAIKIGGNSIYWGGHFDINFNTLLNGASSTVTGNPGKQNIIFGRILSCLNQPGSIVSNPSVICAGEPFQLIANDYFGSIIGWGRRDSNSMTPDNVFSSSDTLDTLTVTGTTYFRFIATEGTGCNSTLSDSIKIVPLPAPPLFNLSYTYHEYLTDSIFINHIEPYIPNLEYKWETSPDNTNWTTVGNDYNYSYPTMPANVVYIRRSVKNPNCNSTTTDVTKIVNYAQGTISSIKVPCAMNGEALFIELVLEEYDSVFFTQITWERLDSLGTVVSSYTNNLNSYSLPTSPSLAPFYFRAKLSNASGTYIAYSDIFELELIFFPDNILSSIPMYSCIGDTSLLVSGIDQIDNPDGNFIFEWTVTNSLGNSVFNDQFSTDFFVYNYPFPNDTLYFNRKISIIGCVDYSPSNSNYTAYYPTQSQAIFLVDTLGNDEVVFCKNSGGTSIGLLFSIGDSIQWGYSYDKLSITYLSGLKDNDRRIAITYDDVLQSYVLIDSLNMVPIAITDSIYLIANVMALNCNADTSHWYKVKITQPPLSFSLGEDTIICIDSINLTSYTEADILGISWDVNSSYGYFAFSDGNTNTLYADTINTPIEIITKIDNGCVFYDTMYVTYSHAPDLLPIPDQTICSDNASITVLNLPSNFVSTFSDGVSFIPNSDSTIYYLDGFDFGENLITYSVTNNNCLTSDVPFIDFVITMPFVADAGPDIIRCASDTVTIISPDTQPGSWISPDNSLTLEYPDGDLAHAFVTGLTEGSDYLFVWTLYEGGCPYSSDTLEVKNGIPTQISLIETGDDDNVFCESDTVSLSVDAENYSTISWNIVTQSETITYNDVTSITLPNVQDGTIVFVVVNSNYCGLDTSNNVTLLVQNPSNGDISGTSVFCENGPPISLFTGGGQGNINWIQSTDGINFTDLADDITQIDFTGLTDTMYVGLYTNINDCFSDTAFFAINYLESATGQLALADTICYGTSPIDLNNFLTLDPLYASGSWNIMDGILNPSEYAGIPVTVSFTTEQCPVTISDVIYISPVPNTDTIFKTECAQEITIDQPSIQNGVWNIPSGISYSESIATNEVIFTSGVSGNNTALISYEASLASCPNNYYYQITFNPIDSIAYAGEDLVLNNTTSTELAATPAIFGIGHWEVVSGTGDFENIESSSTVVNNLDEGTNILQWIVSNENCTEVIDELEITVNGLLIPTAFSPDGDGVNDKFTIRGLNFFKKASLMVFNTMGQEVFTDDNYQSNWTGTDHKGNILPNDTYYIIMKFDNAKEYKGYVIIKK